jgi:protein-tyrosine phosphatase
VPLVIDTHSHLLPWLDHGCPDMETSLQMAREAAASGIETVLCTPHLTEMVSEDIKLAHDVIEQVRAELKMAGLNLKLVLGFEVDLFVAATCGIEELETLTVEGPGRALLLEMPYEGWPVMLEETIYRLATSGFRPVLAHPERNDRVQRSPEVLDGCIRAGAVAQATAASMTGEFGRAPERTFRHLLAQGAISLLASDAHAYRTDSWTLAAMLESLQGTLSDEDVAILVDKNPQRLLAGQSLLKTSASVPVRRVSRGSRRGGGTPPSLSAG